MKQYHDLLQHILDHGEYVDDRTGTGTYSAPGYMLRFNLQDGFPLVTTKKLHIPSIFHEVLWYLRGDGNIKYLLDNNVKIWSAIRRTHTLRRELVFERRRIQTNHGGNGMTKLSNQQKAVARYMASHGYVNVSSASLHFGISQSTIRKWLNNDDFMLLVAKRKSYLESREFDARKYMMEHPNEWVATYYCEEAGTLIIGFSTKYMRVVGAEMYKFSGYPNDLKHSYEINFINNPEVISELRPIDKVFLSHLAVEEQLGGYL